MAKQKIRVLFLDDEENNLRAFKASFRRDYDVFTANTTEEAYELVREKDPQVIISDQRMPVTTGVEFFNALRQVYPDPIRILLTAYTDVKDIVDAINRGHVYRYITKPWNESEISVAIENAYDLFRTRRALKEKIAELEKTNQELNRFIYSASHDLRAPLMSVLGLVKLASMEVHDENSRSYFSMIEKSVNKLDIFIQNIIEYYQNSRDEQERIEINFKFMIDDLFESLRFYPDTHRITFINEVHGDARFFGDEFRIRIILGNLISNAIKYQKKESSNPVVKVITRMESDKVEVAIEDNGVGILQEHLNRIFTMFFKASHENAGSGIGLYIAKEALNKLGGEIEVSSQVGEGTRFKISIPNQLA